MRLQRWFWFRPCGRCFSRTESRTGEPFSLRRNIWGELRFDRHLIHWLMVFQNTSYWSYRAAFTDHTNHTGPSISMCWWVLFNHYDWYRTCAFKIDTELYQYMWPGGSCQLWRRVRWGAEPWCLCQVRRQLWMTLFGDIEENGSGFNSSPFGCVALWLWTAGDMI